VLVGARLPEHRAGLRVERVDGRARVAEVNGIARRRVAEIAPTRPELRIVEPASNDQ
jgi:hypothetical protein